MIVVQGFRVVTDVEFVERIEMRDADIRLTNNVEVIMDVVDTAEVGCFTVTVDIVQAVCGWFPAVLRLIEGAAPKITQGFNIHKILIQLDGIYHSGHQ